jgi:uncharacterized repeat protein (TIGR03803 family)
MIKPKHSCNPAVRARAGHLPVLMLLPLLLAGLGLILTGRVAAQTFTVLHSFTATNGVAGTNGDGANPIAGVILSGNTLYGTALIGGSLGWGTVFAVNTDGTGFTNLHNFTGGSGGAGPRAGLLVSGSTLYGTTRGEQFSTSDVGTVFRVNTDGSAFATLHSFTTGSGSFPSCGWCGPASYTNSDGASPGCWMVLSGNALYGTTRYGGSSGNGTVFKVSTDGTGFTTLHTFSGGDGGRPWAGLILSANTLYGTAIDGGGVGGGTVFAVNTDGTGFTTLHNFGASGDGTYPFAGLILSDSTLYGTAVFGGSSTTPGNGTVFKVNTDGAGFATLHSFTATSGQPGYSSSTNNDGAYPYGRLISSGNTLFGTAEWGGSSGSGTVFGVNTDGSSFTILHNFKATPGNAGLILSGNTLYGTTIFGGSSGNGTVFSLSLPPPRLAITPSGANLLLTWPTSAPGFTLQSSTNLASPVVWLTNSSAPILVNGQNVVTNPVSGAQRFYRLSQ